MSEQDGHCTWKFSAQIMTNIHSDDTNNEKELHVRFLDSNFSLTLHSNFFTVCFRVWGAKYRLGSNIVSTVNIVLKCKNCY